MLFPDSKADADCSERSTFRYVDTALDYLLEEVKKLGGEKRKITAKLVGGSRIFRFGSDIHCQDIGKQNIAAVKKWLQEHQIPLSAEDTGDNFGRTVHFHLDDGCVEIESVSQYKYQI